MSEGIERLRAESARLNSVDTREALDEIERLQTENAFLRKALVRYGCEYVDIISAVKEWGENE